MARTAGANDAPPIIIKRIKKVSGGGHHGGGWKVAYADFATAMMAFFMLLWLLTVSDKVTLAGVADYFTPSNAVMSNASGSGSILAGKAMETEGARSSGTATSTTTSSSTESDEAENKSGAAIASVSASSWETKMLERPDSQLLKAEDDIRTAIQETPELQPLRDQVLLEQTPDGLRIQIIDKDQRPMFRPASAELYPFAVNLLRKVGSVVASYHNRIALQGHTDAAGAETVTDYGNWELSADRANAARRIIRSAGVKIDRFAEVVGRASADPLYPDDPTRPENRRITILLLREAPVVDPQFGGQR